MNLEEQTVKEMETTPTVEAPDIEHLMLLARDGVTEATDGCTVGIEDDYCEHGHPSWLLYLGLN